MLLALSSATLGWGESAIATLPKGDVVLLPLQWGISARMIFAPKKRPIAKPEGMIFLVDQDGHPWLGNAGKVLIDLSKGSLIAVDHGYRGAVFFDGGALVLCTDSAIGYLEEASAKEKEKNAFLMRFHPRLTLPYKNMRLFAGENNTMYVVGKNPTDGQDELFLTEDDADGKKKFVKLIAIKDRISAVAGDGKTTYLATGSLIVRVPPDHKKLERVVLLPDEPIKELAYSAKAGLFYSTGKGVGFVGEKKPLQFLSARGVSLRMRKDSLFVLFIKEQRVMEFGGVSGFSKLLGRR